jgi:hypothetical protein
MKTSNVKKILSIVILSLILAITITTIVLAVVPKKLYNPITDNYKAITVYKDKVSNTYNTADTAAEIKAVNIIVKTNNAEGSEEKIIFTDETDKNLKAE